MERLIEKSSIIVVHAKAVGDADVTVIKTTLTLGEAYKCVQVVTDDTDIFICLLFHSTRDTDITMRTKRDCISARKVQESLEESLIVCLLVAHSVSGCDRTSSFYGMGKLKTMPHKNNYVMLESNLYFACIKVVFILSIAWTSKGYVLQISKVCSC